MRLVEAAERDGRLRPGGTIIEPTSGQHRHRPRDRRAHQGLPRDRGDAGQDVARRRSTCCAPTAPRSSSRPTDVDPESPQSYYRVADRLTRGDPRRLPAQPVREPGQPADALRDDRPGAVAPDAAGRSRTSWSASAPAARSPAWARYLKEQNPAIEVIGADPVGSIYSNDEVHPYLVEGVGEDFWPKTYDPIGRRPLRDGLRQGLVPHDAPAGADRGAAGRRLVRPGRARGARGRGGIDDPEAMVAVILPDGGRAYLSKIFNDAWMTQYGFLERSASAMVGDVLRDEDRRRARSRRSWSCRPTRRVRDAIALLHEHRVSQLPGRLRPRPGQHRRLGRRARPAQARDRRPAADERRASST